MDTNAARAKQKIAPNIKRVKVCLESKEILKNLEWQWDVRTKGRLKSPSLELATTGGNINAVLKWEDIDKPEQLMGRIVASKSGKEKESIEEINHELAFTELLPNTKYEIKIETKKKFKVANLKFLTNTALFFEVGLKKDEINPYRNINAQWSVPRHWTPTAYNLRLFRRSGEKIQENNTGGTTYAFEKLMSGEGFCLEVIATGKDISGFVTSNFVETTHRARNDVNIFKLGAVSNCRHEFIEAGDKVKCRVRWESPNLGVESNNFDEFAITTRAKDISGSGSTMGPIENRDTEAIFSLDWGKKYEISVIGKCRDLDTLTVTEAPHTEIIQTDFEATKKISPTTDGDAITIAWLPAKGAKYYQVKISSGLQGLCDNSGEIPAQQLKYQLKSTPKCSAGHYFEIDVISIDHIGRKKMAFVRNHFLGTADMPQHAQISHSQEDPYRCLEMQWTPPSNPLSSCQCALFTHDGTCVSQPQTKTENKHTFDALKTGTKYYAAVRSLKQDGTQGSWCFTKICETQSGKSKIAKDRVRVLGKVRDLVAAKNTTNAGEITCCVEWKLSDSAVTLKEDYAFESFRLEWSAKGTHPQKKDVLSRNDGTYKEFLNLEPGRIYTIRVIAAYKDRDDDSLLESTEECCIDMGITLPTLEVKYINNQIILTWKKVRGASLYKILITDGTNESVLLSLETTDNDKRIPIEGNLTCGRRCKISLTVVDATKRENSTEPLLQTIGGQNLPHSITLRKNHGNPRRSLELTWNTKIEPEITTIDLYEKGITNPVNSILPNGRSAIFYNLKSSTAYVAQIKAKTGKSRTVSCPSNEVTTDRALKETARTRDQKLEIWSEPHAEQGKAWLKWRAFNMGEGYETIEYHVKVVQVKFMQNVRTFFAGENVLKEGVFKSSENQALVPNVKPNSSYKAIIKIKIRDIDKGEDISIDDSYSFHGPIHAPKLQDITYEGNYAIFQWNQIPAGSPILEIKEKFTDKRLLKKPVHNQTKEILEMVNEFRIGRICEVRLFIEDPKSNSNTVWKKWVIGGERVPREVMVTKNCDNPRRQLNIQFKEPESSLRPYKYRILACPDKGRVKQEEITQTAFTFKYLKSATTYRIQVIALYTDEKDSLASVSVSVDTDPCSFRVSVPPISVSRTSGEYDFRNSTFSPTTYNVQKGKVKDVVEDAKVVMVSDSTDVEDKVKLTWSPPLFSNNQENYKVQFYKWNILENGNTNTKTGQVDFEDGKTTYESKEIPLKWGKSYFFEVKAHYEDIDQDKPNCLSETWKEEFITRPQKPRNVILQCEDGKVVVKWIPADGAEYYDVDILQTDEKTLLQSSKRKKDPCVKFTFDDIGIGSDCYAVVTAINKKKKNMEKSESIIVGGETVPREACAETDPDAPTTSAILRWSPPKKPPDSYLVKAIAEGSNDVNEIKEQTFNANDTRGRMKNLKPGTGYYFKVHAIHQGQQSAGMKTNVIHTRAGPGKVKNVVAKPHDDDPSRSIKLTWGKEAKCTKYRIVLKNSKDGGKREEYTNRTSCVIQGLVPRTKYKIMVAGGNENGFGNYSDPEFVDTDMSRPSNAKLVHNENDPQSASLVLLFDGTGEPGVGYFVILFEEGKQLRTVEGRSPISFENLTKNKRYWADVQVQYDDTKGKGEAVSSNKIYTAPPPPNNVTARLKTEHGIALNVVELKWIAQPGCNLHQINIWKGTGFEASHHVSGKQIYEYPCSDTSCDYRFTVQGRNDSGIFSPPCMEEIVKLAPSEIKNVSASLKKEENIIQINWNKPDDKTTSYLVKIFADNKFEQEEEVTDIQWAFKSKFFKQYKIQVFPRGAGLTGQFTESNPVHSRPKSVSLKSVEPYENSPSTQMRIVWKEIKGIDGIKYEVEVLSIDLIKGTERIESILPLENETSHIHLCRYPGGKYAVRIRAKCNDIAGLWSEKRICQLAPNAVDYVMAEIKQRSSGEKYFDITWKPLTIVAEYNVLLYNVPEGPDSFRREDIHKGAEGEGIMKAEISGFPLGRSYQCEVSALSEGRQGQPATSNEVFAGWEKPQSFTVTLDPKDPTHRALIEWTKQDCVERFELLITDRSGNIQHKTPTEPVYNFENGSPGETYNLTLRWGSKSDFDTDSISKSFQLAPGPPQKVLAEGYLDDGKSRIRVSIENQYANPDFFDVKVKNKATGKVVHHDPELVDNNLIVDEVFHGEVYIVSAQAVIDKLREFPSQEVFSSPVQIVPEKIEKVHVAEKNGMVTVTWPTPSPRVDKYVLKWAIGTDEWTPKTVRGEKFELQTKGFGEEVSFCVAGENDGGVGIFSDTHVHATVPFPPTNIRLRLPATDQETSVIVTFEDSAGDPRKQYGISINGEKAKMTRACEYLATGLTPGKTVNVSIYSIVGIKESVAVFATEPIATFPGKVEKIRARMVEGDLIFEWDHPFGIAPDHYQVEWGRGDSQYSLVDVQSPRFKISLPDKEACYEMRVAAVNASGQGKFSERGTSLTPPPPPRNVLAKGSMNEYGRRSMTITFEDDKNTKKEYFIVLQDNKEQKSPTYMTKDFSLTINGLAPGLSYRAFIFTRLGKVKSEIVEARYTQ